MPTLPASGYPVPTVPTVEPLSQAGTPFQDIRTSADMFGANIAEGLQNFAAGARTASENADKIQTFYNQVATDEQINAFEEEVNKVLYGDSSSPGDVGYLGLQGRNALDQRASVRQTIDKIMRDRRGGMQNVQQQLMFDTQTRRYRNYALSAIGRHYDAQFNAWTAKTGDARVENAMARGQEAANADNFREFRAELDNAISERVKYNQMRGVSEDETKAQAREITQKMATSWARNLIVKDPVKAQAFIEANRAGLGANYDNLLGAVKGQADKNLMFEIATGVKQPGTGAPNLVRGGAIERFLDLTKQEESGGRNIEQGIVPPGGGFNPSVGRVTGPSTASGFYQITDTTWREFRGGVPEAGRYARAIDAPEPVQRAVARHIATTSGVQHWTDYNKALRAAVVQGGMPVAGPIKQEVATERAKPDALLSNLPPLDQGELPDNELPGLQKQIEEAAKRVPPGTPLHVWYGAVKMLRQESNARYTAQRQQEQIRRAAQERVDHEVGGSYIERMAPGSPTQPTEAEILKDNRLSDTKRQNLVGFLRSTVKEGPDPNAAKANFVSLFNRMGLEEGNPELLQREDQIDQAFSNGLITWPMHQELVKTFRDKQGSRDALVQKMMTAMSTAVQPYLFPTKHIANGMGDPGGPSRELNFQIYMADRVREMRKAGKNPLDLFREDSPDYVGKPEVLKRFGKGAIGVQGTLQDSSGANLDLKTLGEVQDALRAGKFGPPGSMQAIERAREYARARGYAVDTRNPVPVR